MARFYTPYATKYTSQFTPLPLDFMYGQLQQKQKAFDTTKSNIAKTKDAFLINSVKGHKWRASELEDSYNKQVEDLTDKLIESGNVNQTALDLSNIQRAWDTNQDRRAIEAYKVGYDEKVKAWEKVKDKTPYNDPFNPYKQALNREGHLVGPEGNIISPDLGDIYEGQDHLAGLKKSLDGYVQSSKEWKNAKIDWNSFQKVTSSGKRSDLTPAELQNLVDGAMAAGALDSSWGRDLKRKYNAQGIADKDIATVAATDMYNANLGRINDQRMDATDRSLLPEWAAGSSINPNYVPDYHYNDRPNAPDDTEDYGGVGNNLIENLKSSDVDAKKFKAEYNRLNNLSTEEYLKEMTWVGSPPTSEADRLKVAERSRQDAMKKAKQRQTTAYTDNSSSFETLGVKPQKDAQGNVVKTATEVAVEEAKVMGFTLDNYIKARVKQKQNETQGAYYKEVDVNDPKAKRTIVNTVLSHGMTESDKPKVRILKGDGTLEEFDFKGEDNIRAALKSKKYADEVVDHRYDHKSGSDVLITKKGKRIYVPYEFSNEVGQSYKTEYSNILNSLYTGTDTYESDPGTAPKAIKGGEIVTPIYKVKTSKHPDREDKFKKTITVRYFDEYNPNTGEPIFLMDPSTGEVIEQEIREDEVRNRMLNGAYAADGVTQQLKTRVIETE